jgi:rRNA methylases
VDVIASSANKKIKLVASLKQKKHRDAERLFIAEGIRLAEAAVEANWPCRFGLCTGTAAKNERVQMFLQQLEARQCPVYEVPEDIYNKISDTQQPQGVLLVLENGSSSLSSVISGAGASFILVLDQLQDPGNVGTIIRTADAVGCSGIIVMENSADIYAGKTVRATMGSLFHLPVVTGIGQEELIDFLAQHKISLLATALDAQAQPYFSLDFTVPVALVLGNEGAGVSPELLDKADQKVFIPMAGRSESLNVATAAAVLLYEGLRQRYK